MERKNIEYRKATIADAKTVCDIVQDTIAIMYPHFYPQAVVDFFCRLHSIHNIKKDIQEEKTDVLCVDGIIIGTGSRTDNHITRVYVRPEYEGTGYGSVIMEHLESDIFSEYTACELDTSLPATLCYEHRGYMTVEHRKYDIGNGEVMIYEIMRKNRQ